MRTGVSLFGVLLRQHRMMAGLSQDSLAERANITTQAIGALERGDRRYPYPETVRRLAEALSLSGETRAAFIAAIPPRPGAATSASAQGQDGSATLSDAIRNLPLPTRITPLVGREGELTAVTNLLRQGARLVTLTGPGGVGKTRLAFHLAADLQASYTRGSVVVDLAALRDPALALPHILRVMGIRETGGRTVSESLQRILADQSLLLVVDNFEQVLPAAADISALLAAVPGLTILTTSREPLRLRDEHEVAISPLRLPTANDVADLEGLVAIPAVALFVARARAVRPTFRLSATNAFAIAEICRRLDGLPLALELAAVRLQILSPVSLLARLEQQLDLLSDATRDVPARHQTLRAAVNWSYDLLTPTEQSLFRRLAVFVGGCTVESVEAVCATDPLPPAGASELLDHLASLVGKNLLICNDGPDGAPRFDMLETIGDYAVDALRASGEEVAMRQAHAHHMVELVEEIEPHLWGPDQVFWIARLGAEQDNVRAAFRWLLDTGQFRDVARLLRRLVVYWWTQGRMPEAERWAGEVIAHTPDLPPDAGACAYLLLGWTGVARRDEQAMPNIQQAYQLARTQGDRWIEGVSLMCSGLMRHLRGDVAGGIDALGEAQQLLREVGDDWGVGFTLTALSGLSLADGKPDEAERFAEAHLALARKMGDLRSIGQALDSLALVALLRNDLARAETLLIESIALAWEVGHQELASYGLHGMAIVTAEADPVRSARLCGAAEALRAAAGAVMWPPRQRVYDRSAQTVRDVLGEAGYETAWVEGHALTSATAITYALQGAANS